MYSLRPTAKLPSQKVVLTVSCNKKQLIDLILTELIYHKDMLNGKLVITGNDPVPIQINQGVVSRRNDMIITHEEADTMIIQQVASVGAANVLVVADDRDVFVLLCHFVFNGEITGHVMMVSPIRGDAKTPTWLVLHSAHAKVVMDASIQRQGNGSRQRMSQTMR